MNREADDATGIHKKAFYNAGLIINTDSDQIAVAEVGPCPSGGLPPISLPSDLKSAAIRKAVCDTPEGDECAFREYARRLRVCLNQQGRTR